MRFKAYILTIASTSALVILALFFNIALNKETSNEGGRWVSECLAIKGSAVQKIKPKIIILSGSNSLFGFSAKRIHENHGIPAANVALHAGLGIDYILYYGRSYFAPERIFVLPLEYSLYQNPRSRGDTYFFQVTGYDMHYFNNLSLYEKTLFFLDVSPTNHIRLLRDRFLPHTRRENGGYQSRTLNAWGDETNNIPASRRVSTVESVKRCSPSKFSIDPTAWEKIMLFANEARAAKCKVVVTYPNIFRKALDIKSNKDFLFELDRRLKKSNITVVGTPSNAAFDEEYIYDTTYHQTSAGQERSTDRLMQDLISSGIIKAPSTISSSGF